LVFVNFFLPILGFDVSIIFLLFYYIFKLPLGIIVSGSDISQKFLIGHQRRELLNQFVVD
jgi:hypothetical protein